MMNSKEFEAKRMCCPERLKEFKMAGVPVGIGTEHLSNRNVERCIQTNLSGVQAYILLKKMSTKMLRKIVKFPHCACRFKGKREP
jgi:hypothetical protein